MSAIVAPAAVIGALAAMVRFATWRIERRYPPIGTFLNIDGVRLHYVDKGQGPPVVLVHGAGGLLQDLTLSVLHALTRQYRVIIFDRPGCGYSQRPADRVWTPEAQAALIRAAVQHLGLDRPLLIGHSFGASVALSYAAMYPDEIRGTVLVSGYYYPTFRPDMIVCEMAAAPGIGWLVRNTVAPVACWFFAPRVVARLFAPNPIPPNFRKFPLHLAMRPSQLRAMGEDIIALRRWARRMQRRYSAVRAPIAILTGSADQVIDAKRQSVRLHRAIESTALRVLPGIGHMLHHVRPDDVLRAASAFDHHVATREEIARTAAL
ncbi:MAG TPA: alpha/beta hydrolase [Alphaproteobacteria bacterium]